MNLVVMRISVRDHENIKQNEYQILQMEGDK